VRREAAEWGLNPIMLAALIRQESAFAADVVSGAGAVGLMQVMPPTGRQLARAHGPENFDEAILTTPEVNLHLGAAFFVEMSRRYGGDLPLVLAAYNDALAQVRRRLRSAALHRAHPHRRDPGLREERHPERERLPGPLRGRIGRSANVRGRCPVASEADVLPGHAVGPHATPWLPTWQSEGLSHPPPGQLPGLRPVRPTRSNRSGRRRRSASEPWCPPRDSRARRRAPDPS
jgi:hypothetical protein